MFYLFQGAELSKLTCYFWFISVQNVLSSILKMVMMYVLTYSDREQCVHFASTPRNKGIQKDWLWRNRKLSGDWKPKHSTRHIINIRKSLILTYADNDADDQPNWKNKFPIRYSSEGNQIEKEWDFVNNQLIIILNQAVDTFMKFKFSSGGKYKSCPAYALLRISLLLYIK